VVLPPWTLQKSHSRILAVAINPRRNNGNEKLLDEQGPIFYRPDDRRSPTWSWASIGGLVIIRSISEEEELPTSTYVNLVKMDNQELVLEGRIVSATLESNSHFNRPYAKMMAGRLKLHTRNSYGCEIWADVADGTYMSWDLPKGLVKAPAEVTCIALYEYGNKYLERRRGLRFIVILVSREIDGRPGVFERIGLSSTLWSLKAIEWLFTQQPTHITII